MRAAIYCRKSTDDSSKDTTDRSTTHQREQCEALIEKNGWTLAEEQVYVDEAVSGAVFGEQRPALYRLMNAIEAKPRPFDVLVMYAEDRLGRDSIETSYVAKKIIDNDVRIFFADGKERTLNNATEAVMMQLTNYAAAVERERASSRVRDKAFSNQKKGYHTGGKVYGYDAVAVDGHFELRPNEAQAAVVRRIFALVADGYGVRRIRDILNGDNIPGPRGKWAKTGLRAMLWNDLYRGVQVFGRTMNVVKKGKKAKVNRPESEWQRTETPSLLIVPESLWLAAHERLDASFKTHLRTERGKLTGKPESSAVASKYLLAGMLKCGVCFANLVIKNQGDGKHKYFMCADRVSKGKAGCTNHRRLEIEAIDDLIVTALKARVLTPERVQDVLRATLEDHLAQPEQTATERKRLDLAIQKTDAELERLTAAVASGATVETLLTGIKTRERDRRELRAQIVALDSRAKTLKALDAEGFTEKVRVALNEWNGLLEAEPVVARQLLRKLLVTPVYVWPREEGGFEIRVGVSYDRSLTAIIGGTDESGVVTRFRMGERPDNLDDLDTELRRIVRQTVAGISGGSDGRQVDTADGSLRSSGTSHLHTEFRHPLTFVLAVSLSGIARAA